MTPKSKNMGKQTMTGNMSRKDFLGTALLATAASALPLSGSPVPEKTFREFLREEIVFVTRRHAEDPENESTCRVIEAEICDGVHLRAVGEGISAISVGCEEENGTVRVAAAYVKDGKRVFVRYEGRIRP